MKHQIDIGKLPTEKPPDLESESPGAVGTATGAEVQNSLEQGSESYRKQNTNVDPDATLRVTFKRETRSSAKTRMTRWFRVYDDFVDDPKVQRLDPSLFKALVNLWCLTSANGGVLPPIDQVAFKLRMKSQKAQCVLDALKANGLLEEDETGTHPHNWEGRQHKSDVADPTAAERMRRHRNRQRNDSVTRPVMSRSPLMTKLFVNPSTVHGPGAVQSAVTATHGTTPTACGLNQDTPWRGGHGASLFLRGWPLTALGCGRVFRLNDWSPRRRRESAGGHRAKIPRHLRVA